METTMHWLPNRSAPAEMSLGRGERAGVDADLVGAGVEHGMHVVHRADSAADGQRHEALRGRFLDDFNHRTAAVGAGGDVEKDHLVSALVVVAQRHFDGIADIAQAALFGAAELDAAGHFAIVNVQTGDDAFR